MIAFQEVFDRHPGVYDVMHTTERPGRKDGSIETVRVATHLRITSAEVIALVRREVAADASAVLTIFAATRGDTGCIGWISRKNIDDMFREVTDERLELSDERGETALLRGGVGDAAARRTEPLREVGDPRATGEVQRPAAVSRPRPLRGVSSAPRKGRALVLGTGNWPASPAAQLVKEFYEQPGRKASPPEAVAAIGSQLIGMGIEFPASLISRLKQQGLLIIAPEE